MMCDVPSARPQATDTTGIKSGHCEASIVAGLILSQTTLIPALVSTISPPICSTISKIALSPCDECILRLVSVISLPSKSATR